MPQPLRNQPQIEGENVWLWKAFDTLSSTRPRGMSVGPISYREVMLYAGEMELGPNSREFLWEVIRKVDAAFLRFLNDKMSQDRSRAQAQASRPKELPSG